MDGHISIAESASTDRGVLRERSKFLFGNRDRLEVALAVARSDGYVNATDLTTVLTNWPNNRIRAQLVALAGAGLLTAMPKDGSGRIWYQRKSARFWNACIELEQLRSP